MPPTMRHCRLCDIRKEQIKTPSGHTYYMCLECDRLPLMKI